MPKERIYKLTLDVKNPDLPFAIEKSIGSESGNLIWVLADFQRQLVVLVKQIEEENRIMNANDDEIPF